MSIDLCRTLIDSIHTRSHFNLIFAARDNHEIGGRTYARNVREGCTLRQRPKRAVFANRTLASSLKACVETRLYYRFGF